MKKRRTMYLVLCIPAVLMILAFTVVPLVNGLRVSLYKWNGYSQHMTFIGLQNFKDIWPDKMFWVSFWNTMIYGFGSTILQNIMGLSAALFLNAKFKGRNAVRVILYMPIMISGFIMGKIIHYFVDLDSGVFNEIIKIFGGAPV